MAQNAPRRGRVPNDFGITIVCGGRDLASHCSLFTHRSFPPVATGEVSQFILLYLQKGRQIDPLQGSAQTGSAGGEEVDQPLWALSALLSHGVHKYLDSATAEWEKKSLILPDDRTLF